MVELRKGIYKVCFLAGPLTNRLYWPAQYTLKTECRPLGTIHFFHLAHKSAIPLCFALGYFTHSLPCLYLEDILSLLSEKSILRFYV